MTFPLIGFVSGWIILLIALIILFYFFGKKGLHLVALIFLFAVLWYFFRRLF